METDNNLYCDPNAYIQNCKQNCPPKKVVFSEPYQQLPNFYLDNNFKRGSCNCVPNPNKPCNCPPHKPNKKPFCYPKNIHCFPPDIKDTYHNEQAHKPCDDCNNKPQPYQSGGLPFNLGGLMSLFGGLGGKGGLNNIISMLGTGKDSGSSGSNGGGLSNIINTLSSSGGLSDVLKGSNPSGGGLSNLISMFTQSGGLGMLGNLFKKQTKAEPNFNTPKQTDICIKDYKRVD